MQHRPATISFYRRPDNIRAQQWESRIREWIGHRAPDIRIVEGRADMVLVLGGDGTILQAAREHILDHAITFGINLGTVGFLASVRDEEDFIPALAAVLAGHYRPDRRMMLDVAVLRNGNQSFRGTVLNEIYVQNPLGMVRLSVIVNQSVIQEVHGTGILVSTPTGSTGYNLSAHGPIIDPAVECIVITEVLDHSIPTPSIVIPVHDAAILRIEDSRKEVILACDGQVVLTLVPGDHVVVQKSDQYITIAEIEPSYFYKSLHEKFSIS